MWLLLSKDTFQFIRYLFTSYVVAESKEGLFCMASCPTPRGLVSHSVFLFCCQFLCSCPDSRQHQEALGKEKGWTDSPRLPSPSFDRGSRRNRSGGHCVSLFLRCYIQSFHDPDWELRPGSSVTWRGPHSRAGLQASTPPTPLPVLPNTGRPFVSGGLWSTHVSLYCAPLPCGSFGAGAGGQACRLFTGWVSRLRGREVRAS